MTAAVVVIVLLVLFLVVPVIVGKVSAWGRLLRDHEYGYQLRVFEEKRKAGLR